MPTAKFFGAKTNGDIHTVFFNNEYADLDIKDKIVIDVGANIGDSSIYFALRGAKKVIAIEPFPENFDLAKISKKNLRIYEVGINYYGRKYNEGKKITWKDGFSAIRCILYYNLFK